MRGSPHDNDNLGRKNWRGENSVFFVRKMKLSNIES
jgi:hypothetical protein